MLSWRVDVPQQEVPTTMPIRRTAWLIGWALILEYTVGGAAVARGISPNLKLLFGGGDLPAGLARISIPQLGTTLDPCAAIAVASVTCLLCFGIKESATFQATVTAVNVAVLCVVIGAGSWVGFQTGWQGYRQPGGYMPFGFTGLLGGSAMVFFSYIGFDTVASTAEEVKHPQRDLPLGIGLSLSLCGALYLAVSVVLVGVMPTASFDTDTPISSVFNTPDMAWAMYAVTAGALAALTSTLLGSLLPQPRILMAMGRDGLLPPWICRIHTNTSVPINATIVTGCMAASMSFFMDIDQLTGMVSVGTLLAFTVVSISVLILRYVTPMSQSPPPPPPPRVKTAKPPPVPIRTLPVPSSRPRSSLPLPAGSPDILQLATSGPGSVRESAAHRFLPAVFPGLADLGDRVEFSPSSFSSVPSFPNLEEALYMKTPLLSEGETREEGRDEGREDRGEEREGEGTGDVLLEAPSNGVTPAGAYVAIPSLGRETTEVQIPTAAEEDAQRRHLAAMAIAAISLGVPLSALALSVHCWPWWMSFVVLCVGAPLALGGATTLFFVKEDEGRHGFGQIGGFLCPCVPLLPISSIVVNVYLVVNLGAGTWIRTLIWLSVGAIIYLFYGIRNSVVAKDIPKTPKKPSERDLF